MKTLKNIAALACVAALAVPAAVSAKGPSGDHGKSGQPHGNAQPQTHTNKRCRKTPRVGFNVKGTVVSYDATTKTLVVNVAANGVSRHAKQYVTDNPLTVTLQHAPATAPAVGDNVVVHGKIDKPKKKCPETDDAVKASIVYTRVTAADTTDTPEQPQQQPTS